MEISREKGGTPPGADWAQVFYRLTPTLETVAGEKFGNSPDSEAAFNWALEKLSANEWNYLRATYKGGSAEGFFRTVFGNCLEEYRRAKYPRVRVPVWISERGPEAVDIYKRLCFKREAPQSILETLAGDDGATRDRIRELIAEIRGRAPNGGAGTGEVPVPEPPEPAAQPHDDPHITQRRAKLELVLALWLEHRLEDLPAMTAHVKKLQHAFDRIHVSDEQLLLLRLHYLQGRNLSDCGRLLGWTPRQASRAHEKVVRQLREAVQSIPRDP